MATIGEKEIKTKWPVVKGTTAKTTKIDGIAINMIPEEGSVVPRREKEGL